MLNRRLSCLLTVFLYVMKHVTYLNLSDVVDGRMDGWTHGWMDERGREDVGTGGRNVLTGPSILSL